MAGIAEAKQRVEEHQDRGIVRAIGTLYVVDDTDEETRFAIIELSGGELHTAYDYGGDVRLQNAIDLGDRVRLHITGLKSAEWRVEAS